MSVETKSSFLRAVKAGHTIIGSKGARGIVGFLVNIPDFGVVGITTSAVVDANEAPFVDIHKEKVALGKARVLFDDKFSDSNDVFSLLRYVSVPKHVGVRPLFAGLERVRRSVDCSEASGTLYLADSTARLKVLGTLSAYGVTICRERSGRYQTYTGAALVEVDVKCDLKPGLAGHAVVTDDSAPFGVLIGLMAGNAVVVPIYEAFRRLNLSILDNSLASIHNKYCDNIHMRLSRGENIPEASFRKSKLSHVNKDEYIEKAILNWNSSTSDDIYDRYSIARL